MGAAHSRARPGAGPARGMNFDNTPAGKRLKKNFAGGSTGSIARDSKDYGYFILCFKSTGDRLKIVNPTNAVLKRVTSVVRKHFVILKTDWAQHSTVTFKLQKSKTPGGRHAFIMLTADVLLALFLAGWEPMTPINLGSGEEDEASGQFVSGWGSRNSSLNKEKAHQTAICFRRDTPEDDSDLRDSKDSLQQLESRNKKENKDCLCLETYGKNMLGFHGVPNALLLDLVKCVRNEWPAGMRAISQGVSCVVSDYWEHGDEYPTLPLEDTHRKYVQLNGNPWACTTTSHIGSNLSPGSGKIQTQVSMSSGGASDIEAGENLVYGIIGCVARDGFKLQISIKMDADTTVYFFIKDNNGGSMSKEFVRLPNFTGVGLGEKNGLYVYNPTITRRQKSFFRNRKTGGKSFRKRLQQSIRRKISTNKNQNEDQPPDVPLRRQRPSRDQDKSEETEDDEDEEYYDIQQTLDESSIPDLKKPSEENHTEKNLGGDHHTPRKTVNFLARPKRGNLLKIERELGRLMMNPADTETETEGEDEEEHIENNFHLTVPQNV